MEEGKCAENSRFELVTKSKRCFVELDIDGYELGMHERKKGMNVQWMQPNIQIKIDSVFFGSSSFKNVVKNNRRSLDGFSSHSPSARELEIFFFAPRSSQKYF